MFGLSNKESRMTWKFKDYTFNTKLERDCFMQGYECRLIEEQNELVMRKKELEPAIPFEKISKRKL